MVVLSAGQDCRVRRTMFYYLGNERLQLWFTSPNICASFLSMTVLLSVGIFLCCINRKPLCFRLIAFALGCAVIAQQILLSLTYSRGGYLALCLGLAFTCFFCRKKWVLVFLLFFMIIIVLTSHGVDRIQSISEIGEGSIRNRLLLWNGGTCIIANHWLSGVGSPENAGNLYTGWYQPLWLNERYVGLISDYLNIAVSYGIFALFVYLSVILTIIWLGLRLWLITKNKILLFTLGAMGAYLFSAVFSTFYLFRDVYWLFMILLFIVTAFIAESLYTKRFRLERIYLVSPVFCSVVFCLVLLSYGFILNSRIPYTYNSNIYQDNGQSVLVCKAIPKAVPKATIVYLFCSDDRMTIEREARLTIRPLLARNYVVIAAGVDSGLNGLAQAEMLLKKIASENGKVPLFLIGQSDGAKHAILIASKTDTPKLSAIVALGSPASWPFDKLSPDLHIHELKAPLLLIHGQKDYSYSYTDSETLKKLCDKSNVPAAIQLIPDAGSYFDEKRENVLNTVDAFITKAGTPLIPFCIQ